MHNHYKSITSEHVQSEMSDDGIATKSSFPQFPVLSHTNLYHTVLFMVEVICAVQKIRHLNVKKLPSHYSPLYMAIWRHPTFIDEEHTEDTS